MASFTWVVGVCRSGCLVSVGVGTWVFGVADRCGCHLVVAAARFLCGCCLMDASVISCPSGLRCCDSLAGRRRCVECRTWVVLLGCCLADLHVSSCMLPCLIPWCQTACSLEGFGMCFSMFAVLTAHSSLYQILTSSSLRWAVVLWR